jgi:hypothetical protein
MEHIYALYFMKMLMLYRAYARLHFLMYGTTFLIVWDYISYVWDNITIVWDYISYVWDYLTSVLGLC